MQTHQKGGVTGRIHATGEWSNPTRSADVATTRSKRSFEMRRDNDLDASLEHMLDTHETQTRAAQIRHGIG